VQGDIENNIENHKRLIELAVSCKADIIIFPELSITGYEPMLAKKLAIAPRAIEAPLNIFQTFSDEKTIIIGAGMPTTSADNVQISMLLFQPATPLEFYSKKYLHADEEPFFTSGNEQPFLTLKEKKIGFAICYEISIAAHAENASGNKADIYIASVAKSVDGVEKAIADLSNIAKKYSFPVLMSNCVGYCDNFQCGGKTSIWNKDGLLLAQLNDKDEGILVINTDTNETIERTLV
jgi:predicted amidohydrolase